MMKNEKMCTFAVKNKTLGYEQPLHHQLLF